jgi:hypothetical protein
VDRFVKARCHGRPSALRLDQAEAGEVRLGREKGEHCARGGDRAVRPVVDRRDRLGGQLADVAGDDLEGGEEALLLALEVRVEDPARDARLLGDVSDRHRLVAVLGNRGGEAGDQPLALIVGDLLAAETVTTRG